MRKLKKILTVLLATIVLSGCNQTILDGGDRTEELPNKITEKSEESESDKIMEDILNPKEKSEDIKYVATIAGLRSYSNDLKRFVYAYNAKNPDSGIKLTVDTYDMPSTEADRETIKIVNEVASGRGPDMLVVSYSDMKNLYEKGALADIGALISDEEEATIWPAVLDNGTIDNRLVGISPFISMVETYLVDRNVIDSKTWTIKDMLALKKKSGYTRLFANERETRVGIDDVLYNYICKDSQNLCFVDFENGKSRFEEDGFTDLLLAVEEDLNDPTPMSFENVLKGEALASSFYAFLPESVVEEMYKMGDKAHAIGCPTERESGNFFYSPVFLAVNRNSINKDLAADFVRYITSDEAQMSIESGFSIRSDIAEKSIEIDDDTNKAVWVRIQDGIKFNSILSGDDKDKLISIYNEFMASCIPAYSDDTVTEIIMDEVGSYFTKGGSIEDVTEHIDRRVSLYLSEIQ